MGHTTGRRGWCEACHRQEAKHEVVETSGGLDPVEGDSVLVCDDCAPRDDRGRVVGRV